MEQLKSKCLQIIQNGLVNGFLHNISLTFNFNNIIQWLEISKFLRDLLKINFQKIKNIQLST